MSARFIELPEYRSVPLSAGELDASIADALFRQHERAESGEPINRIEVLYPSPKTGGNWVLRNLGWVGAFPVSDDVEVRLLPRSEIGWDNFFSMVETAYRLPSDDGRLVLPPGEIATSPTAGFFNKWARVLIRRIWNRTRTGLYRAYLDRSETTLAPRGRINVAESLRAPWRVGLACDFQEHTADVEDNWILAGALWRIAQSRECDEETWRLARQTSRLLGASVSRLEVSAASCVGRTYSRLNSNYEALHNLCRFFLESSGPSHIAGNRRGAAFLVQTWRLFQEFVGQSLKEALDSRWDIEFQERYLVGADGQEFVPDIQVRSVADSSVVAVIDVKSTPANFPDSGDIQQVVAYAARVGCKRALLVYPSLATSWTYRFGDIEASALQFRLDGDLTESRANFLSGLLSAIN